MTKKIIDVDKPQTIPCEIEKLVLDYLNKLPEDIMAELHSMEIKYSTDVECELGEYLSPFKAKALHKSVIEILNGYDFIVHHATRLLHTETILQSGIKICDWKSYIERLKITFKELEISQPDADEALKLIQELHKFKYNNMVKPSVCFFGSIINCGTRGEYGVFCENIGGELARNSLAGKLPKVYEKLKNNGQTVIVNFTIPFTDFADSVHNDSYAFMFICYFAAKYLWDFDFKLQFDGFSTLDIAPEAIVDITLYERGL